MACVEGPQVRFGNFSWMYLAYDKAFVVHALFDLRDISHLIL